MKDSIPLASLMGVAGVMGLLLETWATPVQAAPVPQARVVLFNCGEYTYTDPIATNASVTSTTCESITTAEVLTEGGASFSPYDPSIFLNLTSVPGRGVTGLADLDDYLTFHVGGGGSAVVHVSIAGDFNGTLYPHISVTLALGSYYHQYNGSLTDSIDGNPNTDCCFPQQGDPASPAGATGSYVINYDWTVTDGVLYEVYVGLKATAENGGRTYIDDPLTFQLPEGVTFTSASNSTYTSAVPLPATAWLFGTGCLGLLGRFRRRRATA